MSDLRKLSNTAAGKVLLAAADLLETKGWTRLRYENHGRHCIYGAIFAAGDGTCPPIFEALIKKALGVQDVEFFELAEWNDEQKTRKPVIAALRKAAELRP